MSDAVQQALVSGLFTITGVILTILFVTRKQANADAKSKEAEAQSRQIEIDRMQDEIRIALLKESRAAQDELRAELEKLQDVVKSEKRLRLEAQHELSELRLNTEVRLRELTKQVEERDQLIVYFRAELDKLQRKASL